MTSIREIAAMAKTSPTAVSLILNGRPHRYAKDTVRRVEEAAAANHYTPSSYAQTMRTKRFNSVNLFKSAQQGHSGFDPIAERNFHDALAQLGIRMGIALIDDADTRRTDALTQIRRQWQCDGFAFAYNFPGPAPIVQQLKASPFPVVWYNQNFRYDSVYPDNIGGAINLTCRMLEAGHKKVTFVHPRPLGNLKRQHFSVGDRIKGYLRVMDKAGLKPDVRIVEGVGADAHCEDFLHRLNKAKHLPTAWIFYGSTQAKAFATAAFLSGFRIPEHFSIGTFGIAYDVWSSGLRIEYATEFFDKMGAELGNMLAAKIASPELRITSVKVPMELRKGCASIGPPREIST